MYNVLIVGCGEKGCFSEQKQNAESKILSYAKAIKYHPGFNLIGFLDIDINKEVKASKIWGCNNKNKYNEPIDIVIIATNDKEHIKNLYEALKLKPKLVICEKPLVTEVSEGYDIVLEYKKADIPLMVNYTRRYIKHFQQIKRDIKNNLYGPLNSGYLMFNGGWLHTASHFIDLIKFLNLEHRINDFMFREINVGFKWVFSWGLIFENKFINEVIKPGKIDSMYDYNTYEVVNNAYNHLTYGEKLISSGSNALDSLILTKQVMDDYYDDFCQL